MTVFTLAGGVLASCSSDSKEESKSETYEYQFNENGCDTGKQTFSSKAAYCAGLANETLNKGCAKAARDELRASNCG